MIEFTERERALILNLTMVDPAVSDRLQKAQLNESKKISILMRIDELEDTLENVAADANHSKSKKLGRELDRLYEKLQSIMDANAF